MAEEQEAGSEAANTAAGPGELSPVVEEFQNVLSPGNSEYATAQEMVPRGTPTAVEVISSGGVSNTEDSIYCELGFSRIDRHSYLTLRPGVRLNDEVINGMLHYLTRGREWVHLFSTYLLSCYLDTIGANQQGCDMSLGECRYQGVRRWTRGINLMSKDIVLFPVNWDDHWYLIAVTDLRRTMACITVLNSYESVGNVAEAVSAVKEYLRFECNLDSFRIIVPQVPRQRTRNDCGVFTILYTQFLLANLLDFQVRAPPMFTHIHKRSISV